MRARRRHDLQRMKNKARRLYSWCKCPIKYANNLTVCSCAGCGNPRKWTGEITRQEMRRTLAFVLDDLQ